MHAKLCLSTCLVFHALLGTCVVTGVRRDVEESLLEGSAEPVDIVESVGEADVAPPVSYTHVVYATDGKRQRGLAASLASLLANARRPDRLWVHVFVPEGQSTNSTMQFFGWPAESAGERLPLNGGAKLTVHPFEPEKLNRQFNPDPTPEKEKVDAKSVNEWQVKDPGRFRNPSNFARFLMGDLMPATESSVHDAAVWLDADTVVQGDIAELAAMATDYGKTAVFVKNSNETEDLLHFLNPSDTTRHLLERLQVPNSTRSYNIGVFAVNLGLWHKKRVAERLMRWARYNQEHHLWFSGTNALMMSAFLIPDPEDSDPERAREIVGDFVVAPRGWNFARLGLPAEVADKLITEASEEDLKKMQVLHWSGKNKPWDVPGRFAEKFWEKWEKRYHSDVVTRNGSSSGVLFFHPHGGNNNQRLELMYAMIWARKLNRRLVLSDLVDNVTHLSCPGHVCPEMAGKVRPMAHSVNVEQVGAFVDTVSMDAFMQQCPGPSRLQQYASTNDTIASTPYDTFYQVFDTTAQPPTKRMPLRPECLVIHPSLCPASCADPAHDLDMLAGPSDAPCVGLRVARCFPLQQLEKQEYKSLLVAARQPDYILHEAARFVDEHVGHLSTKRMLAVHVRLGDFRTYFKDAPLQANSAAALSAMRSQLHLALTSKRYEVLFVCSDEPESREVAELLRNLPQGVVVLFYPGFRSEPSSTDVASNVEQAICMEHAADFIGMANSTWSYFVAEYRARVRKLPAAYWQLPSAELATAQDIFPHLPEVGWRQPSVNFDFNTRLRLAARLAVCSGLQVLGMRPLTPCAPSSRGPEGGGAGRPAILSTLASGEAYFKRLPFLIRSALATGGASPQRPLLVFCAETSDALVGELHSRFSAEIDQGSLRLQRVAVSRPFPASGWVLRLKVFLIESLVQAHQGPILTMDAGSVVLHSLEPLLADVQAQEADVALLQRPSVEPKKQLCAALLATRPTSGARQFFGAVAQAAMSLDSKWYDDQRALFQAYQETNSSVRLMELNQGRIDVGMEGEANATVYHRPLLSWPKLMGRCGCPAPGCLDCERMLEAQAKWDGVQAHDVVRGVTELAAGAWAPFQSCLLPSLEDMPIEKGASGEEVHVVTSFDDRTLAGLHATLASIVMHASAPASLRLHVLLRSADEARARTALGVFEGQCVAESWLLGSTLHLHTTPEILPFSRTWSDSLRELAALPASWKSVVLVEAGALLQGDALELAAALTSSGRAAGCAPAGGNEPVPAEGCAAGLLVASPAQLRSLSLDAPRSLPSDHFVKLDVAWRSPEGLGEPESLWGKYPEVAAVSLRNRKLLRWGGPLKPWLEGGQWREFWLQQQTAFHENLFGHWSPTSSAPSSTSWQQPHAGRAWGGRVERPTVLVTTSSGFIDFFENWLLAARQAIPVFCTAESPIHLVVVVEDPAAVKKVRQLRKDMSLTFEVLQPDAFSGNSSAFHRDAMATGHVGEVRRKSAGYNALMRRRPAYLVGLLERGADVLLCDLDAVWLRDPFQLLHGRFSEVDVAGADDSNTCKGEKPAGMGPGRNLCGGFLHFKATPGGLATARDWQSLVENQQGPNQPSLNAAITRALDRGDTTVAALSKDEVVSGCSLHAFSDPKLNEAGRQLLERDEKQVVAIHANYLVGAEDKRALLANVGLWFNTTVDQKDAPVLGKFLRIDLVMSAFVSVAAVIVLWVIARRASGTCSPCSDEATTTGN